MLAGQPAKLSDSVQVQRAGDEYVAGIAWTGPGGWVEIPATTNLGAGVGSDGERAAAGGGDGQAAAGAAVYAGADVAGVGEAVEDALAAFGGDTGLSSVPSGPRRGLPRQLAVFGCSS